MPQGGGKTYCAVSAIQKLRLRTLIIMKTTSLKNQWVARIHSYTDLGGPNIVEIESSEALHKYLETPPSESQLIFITTFVFETISLLNESHLSK